MERGGLSSRTRWPAALALLVALLAAAAAGHQTEPPEGPEDGRARSHTPCEEGLAAGFPCRHVELLAFVPLGDLGAARANEVWGWTDAVSGREYAILGLSEGVAFLDVSDPERPIQLGRLPSQTTSSGWRDIKTRGDHAFVVSEARRHGMQVFDLRRLRAVASPPVFFEPDAHYGLFGRAHNIVIGDATGHAYAVGSDRCDGGLYMIEIGEPLAPGFAGCFDQDGYTHDAQCLIYSGPDVGHRGREICFAANEDTLTIVDVHDKSAPFLLSRTSYAGARYAHQGWLSEDQAFFLLGDELDEQAFGHPTRTLVFDVHDLDAPRLAGAHDGTTGATDHNLYVRGDHVYQANYRSGLRILRLGDLASAEMTEVAYFDTIPEDDATGFSGAWSVYPWLESGVVLVSDITQGLFVLRADLAAVPECSDGIDNDGDGRRDHPQDASCIGPEAGSESRRDDVAIAIRPGRGAAPAWLRGSPWIHVVVLGSASVDVRDLEPESLRFGPQAAEPHGAALVRRQQPGRRRDVDRDGYPDLLLRFVLARTGLGPEQAEACLQGRIAGDPFRACDHFEPRPARHDDAHAPRHGWVAHDLGARSAQPRSHR